MGKGKIDLILDPKTGKTYINQEFNNNDCVKADLTLDIMLELMGITTGEKTGLEKKPMQTEFSPMIPNGTKQKG